MPVLDSEPKQDSSLWADAPDLVLATIFSHLDISDKMAVFDVCTSWRVSLEHPDAWLYIDIGPEIFTHPTINLEECLKKLNAYLQYCTQLSLDIKNFPNTLVSTLLDTACRDCRRLNSLRLYDSSQRPTSNVKIELENLRCLLSQNKGLNDLDMERIKLSSLANKQALPFGLTQARTLHKVRLVQSLDSCYLNNMLYLVSLATLTITPNFLQYQIICHLAQQALTRLNLILRGENSKRYLIMTDDQWKSIAQNHRLRVGCYTRHSNIYENSIMGKRILLPSIPVYSFIYNDISPFPYDNLWPVLKSYSSTLEEFVDFSLNGAFSEQADDQQRILAFAASFPNIHTLSIRVTVTSRDLLILAIKKPGLRRLVMRDNQVDYLSDDTAKAESDVYKRLNLSSQQIDFIQSHTGNRTLLETGMTSLLDRPWQLLDGDTYCKFMSSRYSYFYSKTNML